MIHWISAVVTISVLSVQVRTQGYNGCYDMEWTYHDHTHTCFKLIKLAKTWPESQTNCRTYKGGTGDDIPGYLAQIGDEETNDFVKGLFPEKWNAWIGLYKTNGDGYRWDGNPPVVNDFRDFMTEQTNYEPNTYVSIMKGGWQKAPLMPRLHYICQHDAKIPRTVMLCPSAPIQESEPLTITCRFYFTNWETITWRVPITEPAVATCPGTAAGSCSSDNGYTAKVNSEGQATLSYSGVATRPPEGTWTFSIYYDTDSRLDTKSCDGIRVYGPPSSITCTRDLNPHQLTVTCETDKVYPGASCEWTYKNGDEAELHPIVSGVNTDHSQFTETSSANVYFKSICEVTLTSGIKPGNLAVGIKMYPAVNGFDLSKTTGAIQEYKQIINIELPDKPIFKLSNTIVETNAVSVYKGDNLNIECEVNSGNPGVQSTNLSCQFPFSTPDISTTTTIGNISTMSVTATANMDGKMCTCWGNHITGNIDISSLTFIVLFPASLDKFTANGTTSTLTVDKDTHVNVLCQASGNPSPSMNLLKENSISSDLPLQTVGEKTLAWDFQAKCSHNGNYQCTAHNQVKGTHHKDTMKLKIRVTCPPTLCDENPCNEITPGKSHITTLCAVGYPVPDVSKFRLQKARGQTWNDVILDSNVIRMAADDDMLSYVIVEFGDLQSSDAGRYRLSYQDNSTSSYLHFILKVPEENDSNVAVVVGVSVTVVIIISIIVVVIVVVVVLRKRRRQNKGANTDEIQPSNVIYGNRAHDTAEYVTVSRRDEQASRSSNGTNEYSSVNKRNTNTGEGFNERSETGESVYNNIPAPTRNVSDVTPPNKSRGNSHLNISFKYDEFPTESASSNVNDEGLVYGEIDFGKRDEKPKAISGKGKEKPKAKPKAISGKGKGKPKDNETKSKPAPEPEESTEYAGINATATIQVKFEIEKESEAKSKNHERDNIVETQ